MHKKYRNAPRITILHSISLSGLLSFSPLLCAEETAAIATIDEVVVTAQMRTENLQAVPIAIGAYNKDFIALIGANSMTDMEYAIPNINFGFGGRNTRGEIAIRGIGAYSRNIGTDARVAVYVDGVLTGRSSTFDQSLLGVERVEVLRGPQGTLAGANTIAGAINIITQAPNNTPSGELLGEAGDLNLHSLAGKLNLPLTTDLYASLLLSSTKQDGFIHNTFTNSDLQNIDRNTAKLKFRYVGTENLTLDMGFDYLNDDNQSTNAEALGNGSFNGFTLAPAPYVVDHDADEFSKRKLTGTTINANYETPQGYQVVSITGVRKSEFSERTEEDYSPLKVASSLFDETNTQLSQEIRLVSPQGENTDYVVGAYLLDQDISTQRSANGGPLFPVPNGFVNTPATAQTKSYSAYSNGNWRITQQWEVTGGVRYVHDAKSIDYTSNDHIGTFINVSHLRDNKAYNEFLPKIGLNLHATEDVMFYSAISRGYRSGGWNADFISTLKNFQFNPEYAVNYELGVKSTLFNNRLLLNATSFATKIHDFQIFQFINTPAGTILSYTNAAKATSRGLELDVNAKLYSDLSLSFNAAFTQAKFDEFKNGGGLGVNYDDHNLPFAPARTYYVALDYQHTLINHLALYGHLDYGYSSDYSSNADNVAANAVPEHHLTNARLGVKVDEQWDVSLWVKNLTDEANLRERTISFLKVPRGYYDPPRSYGLTLKYSFK